MTKPIIYLESDLFSEDEHQNTRKIIEQYFNIKSTSSELILQSKARHNKGHTLDAQMKLNPYFRASLNVAKQIGKDFKYANALNWVPYFREYLIDPKHTFFNDLKWIKDYFTDFDITFIRPCDPFKSFSGQVFDSKDSFLNEYRFITHNLNIEDNLMCMLSDAHFINNEYRCIFINNKYISGSKYYSNGVMELDSEVPQKVIEFAEKISNTSYFRNIFNYVIDVAEIQKKLHLIEINAFETASFYAADLDKIYKYWAQKYD